MVSFNERTWIGFRSGVLGLALLVVVTFVGLGSAASAFGANTYYVSKSAGSDSNPAQSKSAPWAHLPGMASCTSNCGSYTPTAGDTFILMGCDVWVNGDLPVSWQWSGTSGNRITITVDKTWYNTANCPSAWNRPVWDLGKTGSQTYFFNPSSSGVTHDYTLDNIEMKGINQPNGGSNISMIGNNGGGSSNLSFTNLYIHGWNVYADGGCNVFGSDFGGTSNILYQYNIVDGSDRTGENPAGGTCDAFYTSYQGVKILNNVIHDVTNGILPTTGVEIGGNLIYNILTTNADNHCNAIETLGGDATYYIHDNVIHNENGQCAGGETMFVGANGNETDYIWNNVIYGLTNSSGTMAPPIMGAPTTGNSDYVYNNTIVVGTGATNACLGYSGQGSGTIFTIIDFRNNHCITSGSNAIDPTLATHSATTISSPNTLMSPSTATNQGYTASETFTYTPTSSTDGTVGAGTNLTSNWPSGFSTNDTPYACTYNSSAQTVNCPARTMNARSGAWDAGAYEYNTGDTPPNPPTALTAIVQ